MVEYVGLEGTRREGTAGEIMQRFAVIGLGRFGARLARLLSESDAEVVAIDRDAALVERIRDEVALAVRLDATDPEALKAQSVHEVEAAVVAIGQEFESSALVAATLKEIGVKRIIARAQTEIQANILRRIGADDIASPERESAMRWAHRLTLPHLQQFIEIGENHSMIHVRAPAAFHHKTLAELRLRAAYGVNLVAIKRNVVVRDAPGSATFSSTVLTVPMGDTTVLPEDILIILGSNEHLAKLPR